jgi:predicted RecB family nuclease
VDRRWLPSWRYQAGAAEEGREDLSNPKPHYGVQVALYTDILERKKLSAGRTAFIIDITGQEFTYDLEEPIGQKNPTTLWTEYQAALVQARLIVGRLVETLAAYSSTCKLCWWHSSCSKALEEADDLTLLPELGRSRRDAMLNEIGSISEFAGLNVEAFIVSPNKTAFAGIGPDMLRKLH